MSQGTSSQLLTQYSKCNMFIFNQRDALFYLNKKRQQLLGNSKIQFSSFPFPREIQVASQMLDLKKKVARMSSRP